MHGHGLAVIALLVFSGLLRPLARRALMLDEARLIARRVLTKSVPEAGRVDCEPDSSPDQSFTSPISLNAIELALIAELNLEMASASEEVANDPAKRLGTRRAASRDAAAWRERARRFELEARRQSAQPMLPDGQSRRIPGQDRAGPERRKGMRRARARRTEPLAATGALGRGDRRQRSDRRERDRRRHELAAR
jgi:hypothetical protein